MAPKREALPALSRAFSERPSPVAASAEQADAGAHDHPIDEAEGPSDYL